MDERRSLFMTTVQLWSQIESRYKRARSPSSTCPSSCSPCASPSRPRCACPSYFRLGESDAVGGGAGRRGGGGGGRGEVERGASRATRAHRWRATPHAAGRAPPGQLWSLQRVDELLLRMFDPNEYSSHLLARVDHRGDSPRLGLEARGRARALRRVRRAGADPPPPFPPLPRLSSPSLADRRRACAGTARAAGSV